MKRSDGTGTPWSALLIVPSILGQQNTVSEMPVKKQFKCVPWKIFIAIFHTADVVFGILQSKTLEV